MRIYNPCIQHALIENIGTFGKVDLDFSPNINVIVGQGGSGKTHLLSALYAILSTIGPVNNKGFVRCNFARAFNLTTLTNIDSIDFINHTAPPGTQAKVWLTFSDGDVGITFNLNGTPTDSKLMIPRTQETVFVPFLDLFCMAKHTGTSTCLQESVLARKLLSKLFVKVHTTTEDTKAILTKLEVELGGVVTFQDGALKLRQGNRSTYVHMLSATEARLALLYSIIYSVTYRNAILLLDDIDAGVDPDSFGIIAEVLSDMAALGTQIFLTTHSYPFVQQLILNKQDLGLRFIRTYKSEYGKAFAKASASYDSVSSLLEKPYTEIYDIKVNRALQEVQEEEALHEY